MHYRWNKQNKKRGSWTEPCGTPVSEVSQKEDVESILAKDEPFVTDEWIQVCTVPDKTNVCSSQWRKVVRSSVSNAAEISNAASIMTVHKSMVPKISLVALSKAYSVQWNFLYAYWRNDKLREMEIWGWKRAKGNYSHIIKLLSPCARKSPASFCHIMWWIPTRQLDGTEILPMHAVALNTVRTRR